MTTTAIPAGHTWVALYAVIDHATTHQLPVPFSIDPGTYDQPIRMPLPPHTFATWAATLVIDETEQESITGGKLSELFGPVTRWTAHGRLPGVGVRV